MMGVIGIHTGSLALAPDNFALYCLLEILSRYSVPAFFFISGYGICSTDKNILSGGALNYCEFMRKRLRAAGLPYITWSLFYLFYFWLVLPPGFVSWRPAHVAFVLCFGLGCYHLYFMVILLGFYAAYPIWRTLLRIIIRHRIDVSIALLLVFQFACNWWTTHPHVDTAGWSTLAKNFFAYRLNYLPLHYLLMFMSGALAALCWQRYLKGLRRHRVLITFFYFASIVFLVGSAYYSFAYEGSSLLALANTYHQLSPQGLIYTSASVLFFCVLLDLLEQHAANKFCAGLRRAAALLAANSMLIYYVHPLLLDWLTSFYNKYGIVMTVKKVSLSYVLLVFGALCASILLTKIFQHNKILRLLFTGKK